MPGSSVSACHMCHLHSHNHENLLKTSPLRNSRGRSRSSSKHRNHHGHTNSGFSSTRDEGARVVRSSSSSALARLTDNSHSLPGSRSNSLSRYHREVSVMPDGGDTYGRAMRSSSSTRSLDMNPPMTTILDARTTSLPRISSLLHSHPHIHQQPDIIVNALPRSRGDSRTGSLNRNAVNLSQDNSHDYYLDIHRQRFKDEKRKHRFNLQTVMLIGCYTLLVMIAIIVGIVLCYQNGWLGLGPPQENVSGDTTKFNDSHSRHNAIDFRNRRKNHDRTNERIIIDDQTGVRQRNRNNINDNNNNMVHDPRHIIHGINNNNVENQLTHQRPEDQFNQRNIRPQVNPFNTIDNSRLQNNIPNLNQNFNNQPSSIPLIPTNMSPHLANENQRLPKPIHSINFHPARTSQVQDSFVLGKPFNNPNVHSTFPARVPLDINTKDKFIFRRPNGEIFSSQPPLDKHLIKAGNIDTNTIAKTLHQAGFPPTSQTIVPTVESTPIIKSASSTQQHKNTDNQKSNVESLSQEFPSLFSRDKILPSDSESLSTQELLDLLAIRRMRDLLNSQGNAQSILDMLRRVEPSEDTRLELIRKENVNPTQSQNEESLGLLRAQGRSIQEPSSDSSNRLQMKKILEVLAKQENSMKKEANLEEDKNIEVSATEILPTNISIDQISSNIDSLINSTINGAIIRLLNKKSETTPEASEVDVDISGVSVFPLNSKDLKILLESSPANIEENLGPLTREKLRGLQILHRLIELNDLKQKVQRHVDDALITHNSERDNLNSKVTLMKQPPEINVREKISLEDFKISNRNHAEENEHSAGLKVPLHNVTSSFNRGSTQAFDEIESIPVEPDPSFAVLVRTDGLNRQTQNKRTVSRSPLRTRSPVISERQRKVESHVPIKERVAVQPGRSRGRGSAAVIRAWTHMDKEGTLSKGQIHSDGSFIFTNCRPIEVCKNRRENQLRNANNENLSNNK